MNEQRVGRVAFIGGASKGIGKACAISLAQQGIAVALCARDAGALERSRDEIRAACNVPVLCIPCDLSSIPAVSNALAKARDVLGPIDILVANSGGPRPGGFFDLTADDWDAAYRSVLRYVIELYRIVLPTMRERKWGRVINIASLAVKEPSADLVLSGVFRSGVVNLAKSLSKDLVNHGVTINTVLPGSVRTDRALQLMNARSEREGIALQQVEEAMAKALPQRRLMDPAEIGGLVAFLASDQAASITGTTIPCDGGISSGAY